MQVHLVFGIYYDNFYLCSIALYTSAQHWLSLEPVIADQGRGCLEVKLVLAYHVKQRMVGSATIHLRLRM